MTPNALPVARDPVYTWLLYDLFIRRDEGFGNVLEGIGRLVTDPEIAQSAAPIWEAVVRLTENRQIRDAANSILRIILDPAVAQPLLSEAAMLIESGTIRELIDAFKVIKTGCDPEDMAQ